MLKNEEGFNPIPVVVSMPEKTVRYTLNVIKSKTFFYQTTIFKENENGYKCFRNPAIVKAQNSNLLVFAEAITEKCSRDGNIDIVMKRSTNNGISWSRLKVVVDLEQQSSTGKQLHLQVVKTYL